MGEGRKNVERIARRFATKRAGEPADQNEVVALQEFLSLSPWDSQKLWEEIQSVISEELIPTTSQWPLGTVGVVENRLS